MEFTLNNCNAMLQTFLATQASTTYFSAEISTPLCLSAFGDLTLEARMEYSVDGRPGTFVASDTITITVVPIRVMIDPGHGGSDPGNIGPSTGPDGEKVVPLQEKDLTLDVGLRLRDRLAFIGPAPPILVFMTRQTDVFVRIEDRASRSEEEFVDVFVSIHFNASSARSVNGTETFYRTSGPANPPGVHQRSIDYATLLAQDISFVVSAGNRGAKPSSASPRGRLGVLDDNDRPAVLTESSFLSNPAEQERLRTPNYRESLAGAHEMAIEEGNNLRPRFRDQRNLRY